MGPISRIFLRFGRFVRNKPTSSHSHRAYSQPTPAPKRTLDQDCRDWLGDEEGADTNLWTRTLRGMHRVLMRFGHAPLNRSVPRSPRNSITRERL